MKLLILGYAEHGKDYAAILFKKYSGMLFQSSSEFANEICIFPRLQKKYGYKTKEECFKDRRNHRNEWFDLITEYNFKDRSRLTRKILEVNDMYVGMRNIEEFEATKDLFHLVVWIDASKRVKAEGRDSCTINMEVADIVITNNSNKEDFERKIKKLCHVMFIEKSS